MNIQEQADKLRKNILWNWPHLAGYGDEMNAAADTMESMLKRQELLEREVSNLTLANEEARKTIDRLNALIPREANDSCGPPMTTPRNRR